MFEIVAVEVVDELDDLLGNQEELATRPDMIRKLP